MLNIYKKKEELEKTYLEGLYRLQNLFYNDKTNICIDFMENEKYKTIMKSLVEVKTELDIICDVIDDVEESELNYYD